MEEILIPKVSEKWCAKARAIPYQGDLRHFLLRLSEFSRQHGRAIRSWQTIQSQCTASVMGLAFCV